MDFLREHGCDVTEEELEEFLVSTAKEQEGLELSDDELMDVAGGTIPTDTCCCTHDTCGCSSTCIRDCC